MTEYAGPELAMWELSHGLEWVAATGLVATLVAPHVAIAWMRPGSPAASSLCSRSPSSCCSRCWPPPRRVSPSIPACAFTGSARSSSRFLPFRPRSS